MQLPPLPAPALPMECRDTDYRLPGARGQAWLVVPDLLTLVGVTPGVGGMGTGQQICQARSWPVFTV